MPLEAEIATDEPASQRALPGYPARRPAGPRRLDPSRLQAEGYERAYRTGGLGYDQWAGLMAGLVRRHRGSYPSPSARRDVA